MNPKQSRFFHFVRWIISVFTKPIKTLWRVAFDEATPAVFVCNHDSSYGPIAMCVYFDLCDNITPWINAQTLHPTQMPAYIREDFWWRRDKWYTRIFDYTVSYLAAPLLPLILCGSACVPVYHDQRIMSTFRGSIEVLDEGSSIILFPEVPSGYREYAERIQAGFVNLAKMYYRHSGKAINFYPTYIDWAGKEIRVGEPIAYEPEAELGDMTKRLAFSVQEYFKSQGK